MIATTTFTAARAVDEALEHLRFGHGAEQHDGLAGRAPRHGGIRTIPDDPDGARPRFTSAPDIFVGFGHFTPLAPEWLEAQAVEGPTEQGQPTVFTALRRLVGDFGGPKQRNSICPMPHAAL